MRRASFACRRQLPQQSDTEQAQQLERGGADGGYTPDARGGCRVQGAGRDVALRHRAAQAKEVFCSGSVSVSGSGSGSCSGPSPVSGPVSGPSSGSDTTKETKVPYLVLCFPCTYTR